ncbi:MAG TPA: type II secretion system protein GspN [Desulfobacteraceae bacterium]|nr:type II secretion system protein GspN [Desulfobacteraceae bacterium]
MNRRILYAAYLVAITVVWLYVQFPAGTIRAYAIQKTASLVPGLAMTVDSVDLDFPLAVRFEDVSLSYRGDLALGLSWVEWRPGWKSLIPRRIDVDFETKIDKGRIQGRLELTRAPEWAPKRFQLELEAVQLADLPILARQIGRKISGRCGGEMVYDKENGNARFQAELFLENGQIEIRQPMIKRSALSFSRIDSEIEARGRSVNLRRIAWQGAEIDGEASGTIALKAPLATSELEIRGEAKPHSRFLTELRQTLPERLMPKPGPGGRYKVQLTGTVTKPHYRLL